VTPFDRPTAVKLSGMTLSNLLGHLQSPPYHKRNTYASPRMYYSWKLNDTLESRYARRALHQLSLQMTWIQREHCRVRKGVLPNVKFLLGTAKLGIFEPSISRDTSRDFEATELQYWSRLHASLARFSISRPCDLE
jgi:hypothetical protein